MAVGTPRGADPLNAVRDLVPAATRYLSDRAQKDEDTLIITLGGVCETAAAFGLTHRQVELIAVQARLLPWRHSRNLGTVGWDGLERLMRSTVAVVGLGGLGGYVVEGLARMGIGRLILIDGDVFAEHNLNRQLLSREDNVGHSKAEVAQARVAEINSAVDTTAYAEFATQDTLPTRLQETDLLVDCTDRLPIRFILQDTARELNLPLVHGAIAGYVGQVMTILPGDEGLRALHGYENVPERGIEVELGNPAATPMMVAAWEVQEAIKILLGHGQLLRNQLLFMDAESGTVEVLKIG
jgi:molybdopterin/thiamine biosynthesis adenylyltransferase